MNINDQEIYDLLNSERLLTGDEVANILNVSSSFAYKLIRERKLTCIKLGRAVRVRPSDLTKFIKDSVRED